MHLQAFVSSGHDLFSDNYSNMKEVYKSMGLYHIRILFSKIYGVNILY